MRTLTKWCVLFVIELAVVQAGSWSSVVAENHPERKCTVVREPGEQLVLTVESDAQLTGSSPKVTLENSIGTHEGSTVMHGSVAIVTNGPHRYALMFRLPADISPGRYSLKDIYISGRDGIATQRTTADLDDVAKAQLAGIAVCINKVSSGGRAVITDVTVQP